MDWLGWATFGFVATLALTAIMVAAQLAGLTRMDLPMMLGTALVADPDRARVAGFFVHLLNGQFFAIFYLIAFDRLSNVTWLIGAVFGAFHGAVALTLLIPLLPGVHPRMASERAGPKLNAVLEPPGAFALNYGRETALITLLAHIVYGAILGFFLNV